MISLSVVISRIGRGIQFWRWLCKSLGYNLDVQILQEVTWPSLGAPDIRSCYLINPHEETSAAVKLNIQIQFFWHLSLPFFLADTENLLCISHMYFGVMWMWKRWKMVVCLYWDWKSSIWSTSWWAGVKSSMNTTISCSLAGERQIDVKRLVRLHG